MQGVGLAHSTDEAGNDSGGKGPTFSHFLDQNIVHTGGGEITMGNAFEKIAVLSEKHQQVQTLMHYVNQGTLASEHRWQQKGKAVGIDGITKEEYGLRLGDNIEDLGSVREAEARDTG